MCRVYSEKDKKSVFVGDVFGNNEGCKAVVVKYDNYESVKLKFLDEHRYEIKCQTGNIKTGNFKNPFHPSVCGIGYLGAGLHTANGCKYSRHVYNKWKGMITRSYSDYYQSKRPSYIGCSIEKSWCNFQVFAEWYKNHKFSRCDYDLDKDLLIKGNKVYSANTCVLLPKNINTLILDRPSERGKYPVGVSMNKHSKRFVAQSCGFKGRYLGTFDTPEEAFYAYKEAKESYIKEVANKYKDQIEPRAYEALIKYEVNIHD